MVFKILLPIYLALGILSANAADAGRPDADFMLVLRETEGAGKQQFGFKAIGGAKVTLNNGETVTIQSAWFDLIGDMHVRFVVDGENIMRNLSAEEFAAFDLSPQDAAAIAIANIKARYGLPALLVTQHDGLG